jgi:hypothetical protein
MKLARVTFLVALVAAITLAVAGFRPFEDTGQAETNPPGWPSCCGVNY